MTQQAKPHAAKWWQRIRTIVFPARKQELAALEPHELEKIARDLRLPVEELVELAGRPSASAKLLHRRLALLGIDPQRLDVAVLRDMERGCSCCESKQQCDRELKEESASNLTPSYCPNQQTLEALRSAKCH